jgi:hypothetical protein
MLHKSVSSSASSTQSGRVDPSLWVIAFIVGVVTIFGSQAMISGMSEGYCVAWPGIGTRFASGFSHLGFARIEAGMTTEQVISLIGKPLTSGYSRPSPTGASLWRPGDLTWTYSTDGSARGGDWAWLSREIVFRNGIVIQKVKWTYYD